MHQEVVGPKPLFTLNSTYVLSHAKLTDILCPICDEVLRQPVESECGSVVCAECMYQWLEVNFSATLVRHTYIANARSNSVHTLSRRFHGQSDYV